MLLRGTVILMAVSLSVASEATAQDTVGEDKISTERGRSVKSIELSREHVAAVNRRRRVVVNFDVIHGDPSFTERPIGELIKHRFTLVDDPTIRIDSIWWNWGEGNQAPYPSTILPLYKHPGYRKWVEDGIDIVQVFLEETKKRGLEVRVNNILLPQPTVVDGWLVFQARPHCFAVGSNLIGACIVGRQAEARADILIEKLEVHADYR